MYVPYNKLMALPHATDVERDLEFICSFILGVNIKSDKYSHAFFIWAHKCDFGWKKVTISDFDH